MPQIFLSIIPYLIAPELRLANQVTVLHPIPSKVISLPTAENDASTTCPANDFITRPRPNDVMPRRKGRDRTDAENPKFRYPIAQSIEIIGVHIPPNEQDDPFLWELFQAMSGKEFDFVNPCEEENDLARAQFCFNVIPKSFREFVDSQP